MLIILRALVSVCISNCLPEIACVIFIGPSWSMILRNACQGEPEGEQMVHHGEEMQEPGVAEPDPNAELVAEGRSWLIRFDGSKTDPSMDLHRVFARKPWDDVRTKMT